jgi:hypothetical protein
MIILPIEQSSKTIPHYRLESVLRKRSKSNIIKRLIIKKKEANSNNEESDESIENLAFIEK